VCGYRFTNKKEHEFYKLKSTVDGIMKNMADPLTSMAVTIPSLSKFPVFKSRYQEGINLHHQILDFLDAIIEDHIKNNDYSNEIEPRVSILRSNKKTKNPSSESFHRL
jgi:hypothetical protein